MNSHVLNQVLLKDEENNKILQVNKTINNKMYEFESREKVRSKIKCITKYIKLYIRSTTY